MKRSPQAASDVCDRCLRSIAEGTDRCPYCAAPHRNSRRASLWLGVAITLAVVFVIGVMIYAIQMDDLLNGPPAGTEQSAPAPDKPPLDR